MPKAVGSSITDIGYAIGVAVGSSIPYTNSAGATFKAFDFTTSTTLDGAITYTGSNGTYFNSAGVLTSASTNSGRFDYDPGTLAARGMLIEGSSTNYIPNNTMSGGVGGSPGTLPTGWVTGGGGLGTLTQTLSFGTESGIPYMDIRLNGTTSTTSYYFKPTNNTIIAAANAQAWTFGTYVKLAAGSLTNITSFQIAQTMRDSGGAGLGDIGVNTSYTPTTAGLATQRPVSSGTTSSASTAYINGYFGFNFSSGVTIDVTLRVGLPQQEQYAFITSPILTSSGSVTRTADMATALASSIGYNSSAGALVAEFMCEGVGGASAQRVFSFNDGTSANRVLANIQSSAVPNTPVFVSSVQQFTSTQSSITANTTHKIGISWAAANYAACMDGGSVTTQASGTIPTVTSLAFGSDGYASGTNLNGWLRRLTYYPNTLSSAQLQSLTT